MALVVLGDTALGAGPARAQSGGRHRGDLHVSTKTVKAFIKRRASVVGLNQTPMFPNARISKTGAFATCSALRKWRRWVCGWNAYVYEESKRDPGPFQVRQSTFRYCTAADDRGEHGTVEVRRARASRSLRVASPWRVACDLTESSIESWNVFAYDEDQVWQPTRSEPLEVPESTLPPPEPLPRELLPAPAGQPGGSPPGPLSTGSAMRSASRPIAHASWTLGNGWRDGPLLGCSPWVRYVNDARYWVYYCYWRPPSAAELPGAALGIFSQEVVTYWEGYYWAGNDNYGRPTGKLFASGQY
ncbi:MAG TPA: hypothetical protein VFT50_12025 [Baekduia sp.]|nr:hypothetical protein [Baekduia sp.]